MKLVISGGWSYGNIGDEAIASSTIYLVNQYFKGCSVICTSYRKDLFRQEHPSANVTESVHCILSKNMKQCPEPEEILKKLEEYHLESYAGLFDADTIFIMAGGGYFHERWKDQFVARILEIEIAKRRGAKVCIIGQSIGPVASEKCRMQLSQALSKCDYICVRDRQTKNLLHEINPDCAVHLAPDLALIVSDAVKIQKENMQGICVNIMPANYVPYVGIHNLCKPTSLWQKVKNKLSLNRFRYIRCYKKILRHLIYDCHASIRVVLSTTWAWDKRFAHKLMRNLPQEAFEIYENINNKKMCEILAEGDLIISTKMHPLIISTSYGVPCIGFSYNYKVDGFMELMDFKDQCFNIDNLDTDKILRTIDHLLSLEVDPLLTKQHKKDVYRAMEQLCRTCKEQNE